MPHNTHTDELQSYSAAANGRYSSQAFWNSLPRVHMPTGEASALPYLVKVGLLVAGFLGFIIGILGHDFFHTWFPGGVQ